MGSGQLTTKLNHMKVEISSEAEMMVAGSGPGSGSGPGLGGLTRQPSVTKSNCLCSPTTHAGSFRCRLHRSPSLQRTKSMDTSASAKANHIITPHTTNNDNNNTATTAQ
ncbi:hypothetical protein L484_027719 [Morus notabilis]|uniref:Serine-rich protein n=1 Tax=Morus notabilis TaxID=981085 RepID=W9RCK7_9ROSA|nr:hypothetical protein L484_027719 [Morus notabilis]